MKEDTARLARLAWLLDNVIAIPGTRWRIGLDAIIGLVPGLGDLAGVLLSSYIVGQAWRMGAPSTTLLRMGINILVEAVVGAIPIAGDVFDAAWKANARNVALLQAHADHPGRAARASRWFVALVLAAFVLLLGGLGALLYGFMRMLMA